MALYRLFQRGHNLGLLEHEVLGYCNSFRVPVQMHYLNASVFDLVGQKVKGVVGEEDARRVKVVDELQILEVHHDVVKGMAGTVLGGAADDHVQHPNEPVCSCRKNRYS